jgi:hypothetical protein
MTLASAVRLGLVAVAACLMSSLCGALAVARPKPPPVVYVPPPPPPMPDVSLGLRFVGAAGVFDSYMREASAISPNFADAQDVAQALRVGVAYEPGQLRRGLVAYGAVAALTDQAFVTDVRRAGATPEARYQIVARIFADPRYVLGFADAAHAAGLAKSALAQAGMRLFRQGDVVRASAYSMQHQAWSLQEVDDREGRAATVKRLSDASRTPSGNEVAALDLMVGGDLPASASLEPAAGPYPGPVVRAVALAALAAIGAAGDEDAPRLGWLTDDYYLDHCLADAKLALFECLAVARPNYEDVFCLGQHAMKDTSVCVVTGAGSAVPIQIYATALSLPPAHVRAAAGHRPGRRHKT